VVLISLDCLNQRQLAQAIEGGDAPHLSALARDAMVFPRAYAHAPWTTPSHMSMLTGLYPSQHGRDVPRAIHESHERTPTFQTLADLLAQRGYETAAFVGQGSISAIYGLGQGFATYAESPKDARNTDLPSTKAALQEWLAKRRPGPFLLFVHTYDLHRPWPSDLQTERDVLRSLDRFVGYLMDVLEKDGLYEGSLLILTGDHGSAMQETRGKCCVHGAGHYEENLRVPLLLKLPRSSRHGTIARIARHVDILPTALDALGIADASYVGPGTSLLREPSPDEEESFASFSEADRRCVSRQAVVTTRYKYIYSLQDSREAAFLKTGVFYDRSCPAACAVAPREELYDLAVDPLEKRNLLATALDAEQRQVLRELRVKRAEYASLPRAYTETRGAKKEMQGDEARVRESVEKAMRVLGYIE
jgi:arylsulfatase A-like enzyme